MHFRARHHFLATPATVTRVLADPDFYRGLALPDCSPAEVLDAEVHEGAVAIRLRYEFVGHLDPVVDRMLAGRRLSWIQEVRVDTAARSGEIGFAAEADAARLHGSASFVLTDEDGGTARALEGDLVVSVPVIGKMAERRIVPGIVARLGVEAAALDRQVSGS